MPQAALTEVEAWPATKASWTLSCGLGKPERPPRLAEGVETVLPAGEDLVGVALVADVPDDAVLRRVEHPVKGDRQLHRPQVGGEVAAGAGDVVD